MPANKYTVREREMMSAIGVPSEFFKTGGNLPKFAFGGTGSMLDLLCCINMSHAADMRQWRLTILPVSESSCGRKLAPWPLIIDAVNQQCMQR